LPLRLAASASALCWPPCRPAIRLPSVLPAETRFRHQFNWSHSLPRRPGSPEPDRRRARAQKKRRSPSTSRCACSSVIEEPRPPVLRHFIHVHGPRAANALSRASSAGPSSSNFVNEPSRARSRLCSATATEIPSSRGVLGVPARGGSASAALASFAGPDHDVPQLRSASRIVAPGSCLRRAAGLPEGRPGGAICQASAVLDKVVAAARTRIVRAREHCAITAAAQVSLASSALPGPSWSTSRSADDRSELFIVEGDSALGHCQAVGPATFTLLGGQALAGDPRKILNVCQSLARRHG